MKAILYYCLVSFAVAGGCCRAIAENSERVVLDNHHMRLTVNCQGGAISSCMLAGSELNPFSWKSYDCTPSGTSQKQGMFICFDRIGRVTPEEKKQGMPFHGEATSVRWKVVHESISECGDHLLEMSCKLPIAQMTLVRTYRLLSGQSVCQVTDVVTNNNPFRKPYNMLQHPSLGPPFLDDSVRVDCNASKGYLHHDDLSKVPGELFDWPQIRVGSEGANLNFMQDGNTGVSNFILRKDDQYGWGCVANPKKKLLVGCLWPAADYPWIRVWRVWKEQQPNALGVEFSTTSLGIPLAAVEERGDILETSNLEWLDPGASKTRTFYLFLSEISEEFSGVERVVLNNQKIEIIEKEKRAGVSP